MSVQPATDAFSPGSLAVVQPEELRPVMVEMQYFFQLDIAWGEEVSAHRPETYPTLHIRPARGWLNDPNGITHHRGRWHVFFQHNPLRAQWGEIRWGHVSSADLVTWATHPVAFGPRPGAPDSGGCWSGAFVPGLEHPAVAYTGVIDGPQRSTVCLRYAQDDRLDEWSEPRVVAREPEAAGVSMMRDPYPFTWNERRFALLGAGMSDGTASLLLFSCDDPHAWRYEGVWLSGRDRVAGALARADIWECPQLVRLGEEYLLVLSLQTQRQLEEVVYLLGRIEEGGGLPRFVPLRGGLLDEGPDFYAPQVVEDAGRDPLMFGWVRQEDAPSDAPEDALAGCLSFPRRLRSAPGGGVEVHPEPSLGALVGVPVELTPRSGGEGSGGAPTLPRHARVSLRTETGSTSRVGLRGGGQEAILEVDGAGCDVWLDGEVAEVYRPYRVASTIRHPGAGTWSLIGDLAGCAVQVWELASPGPVHG